MDGKVVCRRDESAFVIRVGAGHGKKAGRCWRYWVIGRQNEVQNRWDWFLGVSQK